MKSIFESVIKNGGYNLPAMLKKIDSYHISGQLSDADRDELYALARGSADPIGNLDLLSKVLELMDRVKALEADKPESQPQDTITDFVAGKWYRTGDKVTFEGATYICTAPENMVCTWSPAEYPAYWESVRE